MALANLQQELDLKRKNLRFIKFGYKARIKQLITAVELELAKLNDHQGWVVSYGVVFRLRETEDWDSEGQQTMNPRVKQLFQWSYYYSSFYLDRYQLTLIFLRLYILVYRASIQVVQYCLVVHNIKCDAFYTEL